MTIETVNKYLLGIIIAGGVMRIVWLLLMLIISDTPPYKISETKTRIRNTVLAMAVATAVAGLVALIRGYF